MDPSIRSPDTSPEMDARMFEIYRSLTPSQKLAQVGFLGQLVKDFAMARLRQQHPEASTQELEIRYAARSLDAERVRAAWGWAPGDPRPEAW